MAIGCTVSLTSLPVLLCHTGSGQAARGGVLQGGALLPKLRWWCVHARWRGVKAVAGQPRHGGGRIQHVGHLTERRLLGRAHFDCKAVTRYMPHDVMYVKQVQCQFTRHIQCQFTRRIQSICAGCFSDQTTLTTIDK